MTRRVKKPLVKEGKNYLIRVGYTKHLEKKILIEKIYTQPLSQVTEEDAIKEGLTSLNEYKQLWTKIYGNWDETKEVWVIEFRLI